MEPGLAEILLLGPESEDLDQVAWHQVQLATTRVEAVISRGGPAAGGKPNEDAALVLAEAEPLLVMVADAHFGASASVLAVDSVARIYRGTAWGEVGEDGLRDVLLRMVRVSQGAILERGEGSETTLLAGLYRQGVLHWANVGDSYLYRLPPRGGASVINTPAPVWLGARIRVPVHELTEIGRCRVEAGTRVLLATDGIPEPRRGILAFGPSRIRALLDVPGERPLERLARAALEEAGEDNIAGVLLTGG